MTQPGAGRRLGDVVSSGERRRRTIAAADAFVRHLPVATAVLAAVALVVRLTSLPTVVVGAAAAAAAASLLAAALWAARSARSTDVTAARLDADAHLHGALRSGHWFAAAPAEKTDWVDFHVDRAADGADGVDWRNIYAVKPAGRSLALAAAFVAVALAVIAWPTQQAAVSARGVAGSAATDPERRIPDFEQALADLASGKLAPEDMRELLEMMLEDPSLDDAMREELQQAAGQQAAGEQKGDPKSGEQGQEGQSERQGPGNSETGDSTQTAADREWAQSEDASRKATEDAQRGSPSAQREGEESGEESEKGGAPAGAKERPQTGRSQREQNQKGGGGLSMEADGDMPPGGSRGDGLSSAGGANTPETFNPDARAVETSDALKREVIRAIDAEGKNIQIEEPRRTEARQSGIGFSGTSARSSYDRATTDASGVPEERRALLERYFVREAR